jgi:hypothetical protein
MSELIQALSRLASNRHADGQSSIVSQDDRKALIDGCYDLMLAARQAPVDRRAGEAEAFDRADWFWRTMDPDDSGDSPSEALNGGMVGPYCVCEVGSSYAGPTRFGFIAPVLDPESDDEEFLHFATQEEAVSAANDRRTAVQAMEANQNDEA